MLDTENRKKHLLPKSATVLYNKKIKVKSFRNKEVIFYGRGN